MELNIMPLVVYMQKKRKSVVMEFKDIYGYCIKFTILSTQKLSLIFLQF